MQKKILYYLNQFFGQIGGEDKADFPAELFEGTVGASMGFQKELGDAGEVVATIVCGDNYFNEHREESTAFLKKVLEEIKPDLIVAGPAFNAGRYGVACAEVAKFAFENYKIKTVSGMYEENPGVDAARGISYIVPTGNSAGDMKKALPAMASMAKKLLSNEEVKPADGYFAQGRRETILVEKNGAQRAYEMMMKRLNDEPFETELPMPEFDTVDPAPAIKDMKKAVIALVTSGGIVPEGNPDRIQSASAQKWGKYEINGVDELKGGDFITIHGGYDPVYANARPDRVVPLDVLRKMEKDGEIGKVYDYFYTTTGTGTAVGNAILFGKEIGAELKAAGVDGVILTST